MWCWTDGCLLSRLQQRGNIVATHAASLDIINFVESGKLVTGWMYSAIWITSLYFTNNEFY